MHTDYSDEDTEQARQTEYSSAGKATQILTPPHTEENRSGNPIQRRNSLLALGLVSVGVLLWLSQFAPFRLEFEGGMVLLTIASCFLFFALWRRIYGLLIPGCILAGLSIGVTFADVSNGVSVLWGLSLGFLAILLVGRAWFNVQTNWPIYPAAPLFAVGIIVAITSLPSFFAGGFIWLPLLLIGAGIYLGWRRGRR